MGAEPPMGTLPTLTVRVAGRLAGVGVWLLFMGGLYHKSLWERSQAGHFLLAGLADGSLC